MLKSIKINGLLSFKDVELEMRPLNVLVGANASGKSNLIEIMALLQALPRDLAGFFRRSGGVSDWFWKGEQAGQSAGVGTVEASVVYEDQPMLLRYTLTVADRGNQLHVIKEGLHNPNTDFSYQGSLGDGQSGSSFLMPGTDHEPGPEVAFLRDRFDSIRLYRGWHVGYGSPVRSLPTPDSTSDFLKEDFSNLAPVLRRLAGGEDLKATLDDRLHWFEQFNRNLGFDGPENQTQLWVRERGLSEEVPVARLSDGTLRLLALLSILCDPSPPPLVCIEEPELGLHPNVVHMVAKLLLAAAERTQLIVTTHSPGLIDLLWENPEDVVVLDKFPDTGTRLSRLDRELTRECLDSHDEGFGELWLSGHFGGVWP